MSSIKVDSPSFTRNQISLKSGSFFKGPAYYYNDSKIQWKRKKAKLLNDHNQEVEVALSSNPFDPFPWISVEGSKYYPMGKLSALENVFVYLPLILIYSGGAIGGLFGALASMTNASLMREFKDAPLAKYGLSIVATAASFAIWFMIATMLRSMILK